MFCGIIQSKANLLRMYIDHLSSVYILICSPNCLESTRLRSAFPVNYVLYFSVESALSLSSEIQYNQYNVVIRDFTIADPFTQVVWKNSHQFGAALNVGEDRLYVVAYYIPKGNQPNEYVSNVPKLKWLFKRHLLNVSLGLFKLTVFQCVYSWRILEFICNIILVHKTATNLYVYSLSMPIITYVCVLFRKTINT